MSPCKHHDDFPASVEPDGQVALLTVMALLTLKGNDFAVPDRLGTMEVDPMLFYIGFTLGRIPFKVHDMNIHNVYTKSSATDERAVELPITHPFTRRAMRRLGLRPPRMRGVVNGENATGH